MSSNVQTRTAKKSKGECVDAAEYETTERTAGLLYETEKHIRVTWYPLQRKYSLRELLLDQVVLGIGCIFCAVAVPLLLRSTVTATDEHEKLVGVVVYCIGLIVMSNCSCLFNAYASKVDWFPILQCLDQVGIYIMIAGSATPLCIQCRCHDLLGLIWALAVVGFLWQWIMFEVPMKKRKKLDIILFLLMGWSLVFFKNEFLPYVTHRAAALCLCTGVTYTVGAVINAWESLEFHKSIWHACVLIASFTWYVAVYMDFASSVPVGTKH